MSEPRLLSTWSFSAAGHRAAWPALLAEGGSLDAVEAVCRQAEADPEVDSVGFGGLPDRDGVMSFDGCVMLSPRRCGSVCAVRHYRHPVSIARLVMERSPHVMLAGPGAESFAAEHGIVAEEVLSEAARRRWHAWLTTGRSPDQSKDQGSIRPVDQGHGALFDAGERESRWDGHDTVGVLAMDRGGELAGACSTSGAPFKLPGRVGDSPIIGHGLYVDPSSGGATATGTGELVMGHCSSFAVVSAMRDGAAPVEAIASALERIRDDGPLADDHQVALVAMDTHGRCGAGALRPGFKCVETDANGTRIREPDIVLIESP